MPSRHCQTHVDRPSIAIAPRVSSIRSRVVIGISMRIKIPGDTDSGRNDRFISFHLANTESLLNGNRNSRVAIRDRDPHASAEIVVGIRVDWCDRRHLLNLLNDRGSTEFAIKISFALGFVGASEMAMEDVHVGCTTHPSSLWRTWVSHSHRTRSSRRRLIQDHARNRWSKIGLS